MCEFCMRRMIEPTSIKSGVGESSTSSALNPRYRLRATEFVCHTSLPGPCPPRGRWARGPTSRHHPTVQQPPPSLTARERWRHRRRQAVTHPSTLVRARAPQLTQSKSHMCNHAAARFRAAALLCSALGLHPC